MRPVTIVLAAIGVLALPLIYLAVVTFFPSKEVPSGPGIDSGARIEIEILRQQIEGLQTQITDLEGQMRDAAAARNQMQVSTANQSLTPLEPLDDGGPLDSGPNTLIDSYASVVLIANRRKVNKGINVAGPSFLEKFLGRPREVLSDNCEAMTNPKLRSLLNLTDVGPIRVNMLKPASDSIKRIFAKVKATDPDLYDRIQSSGSLCVRQIRGTKGRTSTHSFGLAVDLNIDGTLDNFADGKTQLGLTILADFFIEEGWVWGAGFSREDSMHFEVSKQMLTQWRKEGKI